MDKDYSFSTLYRNRKNILENPERYYCQVTHFSADGFGACAYKADITAAELVSCWRHKDYQTKCPYCGEVAYITRWAGKVNDGCFWDIRSFCPHCGKEHHASMCGHKNIKGDDIHYRQMMEIAQSVRNELEQNRYVNYISVVDAFKRNGWERSHKFQVGNSWRKGEDEVTCFLGKYIFNGEEVDAEFIHRMLHIDKRYRQICECFGQHEPLHSLYGRIFLSGVKWADSTPVGQFDIQHIHNLNFSIVLEAFEKDGWVRFHGVAKHYRWMKGNLEVEFDHGIYKMNKETLDAAYLCEMLHIDHRTLQVSKAVAPTPIHSRYGQAFLAGVRWADEHPIGQ